jgi:hypothetical protein
VLIRMTLWKENEISFFFAKTKKSHNCVTPV